MKIIICILFLCVGLCYSNLAQRFEMILEKTGTEEEHVEPTLNFTTKCFEGIGCYYNGPPFFDPVSRPISLPPGDNPMDKIHYLLYTKKNRANKDYYTLKVTEESIRNSHFNPNYKTMVYAHGWQLTFNESSESFRVKDALFDYRDDYYNFIIINWSGYNGDTYESSIANARVVGTVTSILIKLLQNTTGSPFESFHAIGHSLGGQLIAYIGQETPNMGRLTALDASGSCFYHTHKDVRLDASDALFVDAIHACGGTDAFDGLGYGPPYAQQDFYPNGGQRQPDCGHEDPYIEQVIKVNPVRMYLVQCCDHGRSVDYFVESIVNKNCTFKGTQCNNYDDWVAGNCPSSTHPVAVMGIDAAPIPGIPPSRFFLDTETTKPYCKPDGYENSTMWNQDL